MTIAIKPIERYYDYHNLEGEEIGQSDVHSRNIHYLQMSRKGFRILDVF